MKILFAADEQPYSAYALKEVTRLALNTWADVTILGVAAAGGPGPTPSRSSPCCRPCTSYREGFLQSAVGEGLAPYALSDHRYEWVPLKGRPLGRDAGGPGPQEGPEGAFPGRGRGPGNPGGGPGGGKRPHHPGLQPRGSSVSGAAARRCPSGWSMTPTVPSCW